MGQCNEGNYQQLFQEGAFCERRLGKFFFAYSNFLRQPIEDMPEIENGLDDLAKLWYEMNLSDEMEEGFVMQDYLDVDMNLAIAADPNLDTAALNESNQSDDSFEED